MTSFMEKTKEEDDGRSGPLRLFGDSSGAGRSIVIRRGDVRLGETFYAGSVSHRKTCLP